MRRRIKKADVKFVSLCPKGANKFPVLYKEDGGIPGCTFEALTKALPNFDEQGEITAVVYAPEIVDAQGDSASAQVIKDMAHRYARNGLAVDVRHDLKPLAKDQVAVVESFLIQKGDPRFSDMKDYDGKPVDVTGGWGLVMKIDDPAYRALYKAGAWNGVSLWGPAEFEPADKAASVEHLADELAKRLSKKPEIGEIDMDAKELAKLLDERDAKLLEKIAATVAVKSAPEAKPETPAPAPAPKPLAFNPTSAAEVKKHLESLERATLEKAVDWTNPEAVKKHLESLEKAPSEESAEIVQLKKEVEEKNAKLAKLMKASPVVSGEDSTVSKTIEDRFALGKSIGAIVNELNGTSKK